VQFKHLRHQHVPCIVGPQLFISTEAPLYRTAMRTIAALYSVFIHRSNGAHRRENARDRLAAQGEREALRGAPAAGEDNETDKKDLWFRYVLWRRLEILGRIG